MGSRNLSKIVKNRVFDDSAAPMVPSAAPMVPQGAPKAPKWSPRVPKWMHQVCQIAVLGSAMTYKGPAAEGAALKIHVAVHAG